MDLFGALFNELTAVTAGVVWASLLL